MQKNIRNCILLLFCLLIIIYSNSFSSLANDQTPLLNPPVKEYYVRFTNGGLSIYDNISLKGQAIARLNNGDKVELIEGPYDISAKVRIPDSGVEGYVDVQYLKKVNAIVEDCDLYTYDEMVTDLVELSLTYPTLFTINSGAMSLDNRPIYEITLGNPSAPKNILIHAGIHAREYLNPYLVMEQLEMCLDFYQTGTFASDSYVNLFSQVAVHIIPMVNPDGISISQLGESAIRSENLRKQLHACYSSDIASKNTYLSYESYLKNWKSNAAGVDLNRNFPAEFKKIVNASYPSYAFYAGPAPLSEPESQYLALLTTKYQPNATINYHSMGQVLYWSSNIDKFSSQSNDFANMINQRTGYLKMPVCKANGGYLEWINTFPVPIYSITIETGKSNHPMSYASYPGIWKQNALILLSTADYVKRR